MAVYSGGMLARLALASLLVLAAPALAAPGVLWQGAAAGRAITLATDDVRLGAATKPLLSLKTAWLSAYQDRTGGEQHAISWHLRSLVGPLLSVETHGGGYSEGAAHPYAYADIKAYDVRTGAPAKLTDWFPARDIHAALLGDALVRRAVEHTKPRPQTLERLVWAIQGYQSADCTWGFSEDLLSRFTFHHVAGDRVAVRFGLSHGCEVARGRLTVLAVYLPIPPELRAPLEAARTGRAGFLVPGAPQGEARAELGR